MILLLTLFILPSFLFIVLPKLISHVLAVLLVKVMLYLLPILIDFLHPLPVLNHLLTKRWHFLFVNVVLIRKELLKLTQGDVALPILINETDHLDCTVNLISVALLLE